MQVFRLDLHVFQFCHGKCNMAIRVFPLAIGYVIREERVKPGNSTTVSPSTSASSTDPTGDTSNQFYETKIKAGKTGPIEGNLSLGGLKTCQCRRDMRWNTKALECQVELESLIILIVMII